jgi:hypothetical protein
VIPDFTDFPPEIINFLPYILDKSGINSKKIKKVELGAGNKGGMQITTTEGLKMSIEIRLSKQN